MEHVNGNPGPGGYGIILMYENNIKEISGGEKNTTNNKMELMAAIVALETLKEPCNVTLYSDSAYLINGFNLHWIDGWKKNNWKNSSKQDVKNRELWERLDKQSLIHKITFVKVKGHSDNEYNNRCDELAVMESKKFM